MHHDFFRAVFWALVWSFFFLLLLVRLVLRLALLGEVLWAKMKASKASGKALDVHNSVCFVWFSAHCCFCSLFGLGSGQDASGGLKMRYLEGQEGSGERRLEAGKSSWGVRQVGTRVDFALYFTI